MNYDDNQALSLGRYQRAARFPVLPIQTIELSYETEIQTFLNGLHPKLKSLFPDIRQLIRNAIEQMTTLPASSSHHHRTSGGLFYHSFEVALLAWNYASDQGTVRDGIAAFICGLLHDLGKTASLFQVSKLATFDPFFGQANFEEACGLIWNPKDQSLSTWCSEQEVKHMALKFRYRPQIGHVTLGAELWRPLVPQPLLDYIGENKTLLQALTQCLDGKRGQSMLAEAVSRADQESIKRDLNPGLRTQPKRSDMHMARRFIEFQYLAPWNTYCAPFVLADIYVGDELTPVGQSHAFFVATSENLAQFVSYVCAEDLYGHVAPPHQREHLLYTLESLGILRRSLPGRYGLSREANPRAYNAPFSARLDFEDGSSTDSCVPLCFFPHVDQELPTFLPEVRALFQLGSNQAI